MRKIKFRVWNKCENQYDYDFLIYKGKPCIVNGEIDLVGYTCWGEIEQFTGLKDKNGVEIYEGDIVTGEYYNLNVSYNHKGVVSMGYTHDSDGWACGTTYGWVSNHSDENTSSLLDLVNGGYCEVIGNTHKEEKE